MQSAGNLNNLENESLVKISDHLKNFKYLLQDNDEQFGYYLAGLIEGSGTFNKETLEIEYEKKDIQSLFWLKKRLKVGTVKISSNFIKLIVKNKKGLENIIKLTNGKYLTDLKIKEWKKYEWEKEFNFTILPTFNPSLLKSNPYIAGYFDTCGLFKVEIKPLKLECSLEGKNQEILEKIKSKFGGEIVNKRFCTKSFTEARNFIEYFDKYTLCSLKFIQYMKWRDVYRITQKKEHLTNKGLEKILKLKLSISKF